MSIEIPAWRPGDDSIDLPSMLRVTSRRIWRDSNLCGQLAVLGDGHLRRA